MPNIHTINAQGTDYGIEAKNGITQAQAAKIETVGDVSALTTEHKQNTVVAINEVNGKIPTVRTSGLPVSTAQTVAPNTEVTLYSSSIALSANETPIGIIGYDAGVGADAQKIMCKGISIEINRTNATCRLKILVAHTYDTSMRLSVKGEISIFVNGN